MTNEITYGVAVLAVIAIAMAAYSLATPTDTSDFVTISDQKEFILAATGILDGIQEPCYQDEECKRYFANKFVSDAQVNSVINDLVAVDERLLKEIIINQDNFLDNHPFNFEPEEIPVESEIEAFSTLLAINIKKPNWICGEKIIFTGNALAHGPQVRAQVTEPDGNERYLNAIVYPNGEYSAPFGTPLGCPLGEYSVFVEQGRQKSQTVSFNIVGVE